jgi:membrane associated rhomboid family serine protease/Flp pilus assembly protein TadD
MASCARCGRELPTFSFGEASQLCSDCKKVAERPKEAAPRLASEAVLSNEKRAPYRPPFTLAIIGLNVLVFAAMVATGVPIVNPNSSHLLKWGADYGPYALGGQPWRILTSNYVHIGIVHLAVNMWSLWMVGRLSERIFGGWTYLFVYTASGIAGSLASLLWHPTGVSAGASGAIFGMVGALIGALYLGKLPFPKPVLQGLLKNLVMVAAINLIYGASSSAIDNSAHVGGLLSGLALGAILAPQLMEPREQRRAHERILFVAAALLLLGFGSYVKKKNGYVVALGGAGQPIAKGQLDEAISRLAATVARNPKNKSALGLLGSAYLQKKDYPRAENVLTRLVQLDPDNMPAKYNLGLTYGAMGRYEDAHRIFAELVQQDPTDDDAVMLLGTSLDGLGREQEAVDAYQKAIALNPRNAEAFRELGLAQMKLNQPGAAVASLQQSARLDPENPETQKDLGDVYTAMGNFAGAQVAFRKSEELKKAAAK